MILNRNLHSDGLFRMKWGTEINCKNGRLEIGKNLQMQTNVHLVAVEKGNLIIRDNVFFNRNCIVIARKNISIGAYTVFGPNVCVYDHNHIFDSKGVCQKIKTGEITIGNNCWIGAGVIILKDTHIGDGCVIGAGTVVKGNIPPHSLVTNNRNLDIRKIGNR